MPSEYSTETIPYEQAKSRLSSSEISYLENLKQKGYIIHSVTFNPQGTSEKHYTFSKPGSFTGQKQGAVLTSPRTDAERGLVVSGYVSDRPDKDTSALRQKHLEGRERTVTKGTASINITAKGQEVTKETTNRNKTTITKQFYPSDNIPLPPKAVWKMELTKIPREDYNSRQPAPVKQNQYKSLTHFYKQKYEESKQRKFIDNLLFFPSGPETIADKTTRRFLPPTELIFTEKISNKSINYVSKAGVIEQQIKPWKKVYGPTPQEQGEFIVGFLESSYYKVREKPLQQLIKFGAGAMIAPYAAKSSFIFSKVPTKLVKGTSLGLTGVYSGVKGYEFISSDARMKGSVVSDVTFDIGLIFAGSRYGLKTENLGSPESIVKEVSIKEAELQVDKKDVTFSKEYIKLESVKPSSGKVLEQFKGKGEVISTKALIKNVELGTPVKGRIPFIAQAGEFTIRGTIPESKVGTFLQYTTGTEPKIISEVKFILGGEGKFYAVKAFELGVKGNQFTKSFSVGEVQTYKVTSTGKMKLVSTKPIAGEALGIKRAEIIRQDTTVYDKITYPAGKYEYYQALTKNLEPSQMYGTKSQVVISPDWKNSVGSIDYINKPDLTPKLPSLPSEITKQTLSYLEPSLTKPITATLDQVSKIITAYQETKLLTPLVSTGTTQLKKEVQSTNLKLKQTSSSIINFDTKKIKQSNLTGSITKEVIETKQVPVIKSIISSLDSSIPKSTTIQKQTLTPTALIIPKQISVPMDRQVPISKTILKTPSLPKSPGPTNINILTPSPNIFTNLNFSIPKIDNRKSIRGTARKINQGFRYNPSLVAVTFNIKRFRLPKVLTGFGIRPIKSRRKKRR